MSVVKLEYTLETQFIWKVFKAEKYTTAFSRQFQWLVAITLNNLGFFSVEKFSWLNFHTWYKVFLCLLD